MIIGCGHVRSTLCSFRLRMEACLSQGQVGSKSCKSKPTHSPGPLFRACQRVLIYFFHPVSRTLFCLSQSITAFLLYILPSPSLPPQPLILSEPSESSCCRLERLIRLAKREPHQTLPPSFPLSFLLLPSLACCPRAVEGTGGDRDDAIFQREPPAESPVPCHDGHGRSACDEEGGREGGRESRGVRGAL